MSAVEAGGDTVAEHAIAVAAHLLVFPVFGLHTALAEALRVVAVLMAQSLLRRCALRRVFEGLRTLRTD